MLEHTVDYQHHKDHKGIIIQPVDRNMDIVITVDYTGMPYAPVFHLVLESETDLQKKSYGDESVLFGEQVPSDVDYISAKG